MSAIGNLDWNLIVKLFDFIKNLAQIINKMKKFGKMKKKKLIYAKMVKVLLYEGKVCPPLKTS
jgi:hypothetical protein